MTQPRSDQVCSPVPLDPLVGRVQRWTSATISPADHGGFVAYGDYIDLQRENARLRAALVELTRLDPPESIRANVRVVIYGNDARDFALRVLTPNASLSGRGADGWNGVKRHPPRSA